MESRQSALPHFLIIGAMKAGTTSVHEDLLNVDGIYMCPDKEPNDLASDFVLTKKGRESYEEKFRGAQPADVIGEASTAYSKEPFISGVARRARDTLGDQLKIIYITREPISRIVSQYKHLWSLGLETRNLNEAVLEDPEYAALSRYDYQLSFWREQFSESQILVLTFEQYITQPTETVNRILRFIGVKANVKVTSTHRNDSNNKRIARPGSIRAKIQSTNIYQFRIKPLLSRGLRDRLKALLLPRGNITTETLSPEVRKELLKRL